MQGLSAQVRVAVSVGLVGGFVLGCREALLSLHANAAIQPDQYLLVYLAAPILAWLALGPLLLTPLAVLRTALHQPPRLPPYAALLAAGGALSVVLPWRESVTAVLQAVGIPIESLINLVLYAMAAAAATACASIAAAVAAWYCSRTERALHYAARGVVLIAILLLWPVARFVATDWTWVANSAAAAAAIHSQDTRGERPNVVLMSIDTLRADHLGSYGDRHGLTPNLDRFAAQGVRFEPTITAAPWTLPAVASLFTALYPRHHGAGRITNYRTPLGRSALPAGSWTLTRALHERGYRTSAIVTNAYLTLHYGLGEDFDQYENISVESEGFISFANTTAVRLLTWLWPDAITGDRGDTVSKRAVSWLARAASDRPFFLWLHYLDPHPPYSAAGVTRHKSMRGGMSFAPSGSEDGADTPARAGSDVLLTSPDVARLRDGEIRLNAAQKEAVHNLYRAEVRTVDAAVGRVLAALDRTGLGAHTLVVVVADHGEEFWEHGGSEHGRTVYEEVISVPLIMRWPGHLPAGKRVAEVTRITDVAPTVLDLLEMPVPPQRDGDTLVPLVRGEASAPRVALTENMLLAEERVGLRTRDHQYIHWEDGREEVYDLATDPQERRDLVGVDGALRPLRQLYAQADAQSRAHVPDSTQSGTDGRTREALRSLGYIN
jgi:arylsulfatase A-like enzyme